MKAILSRHVARFSRQVTRSLRAFPLSHVGWVVPTSLLLALACGTAPSLTRTRLVDDEEVELLRAEAPELVAEAEAAEAEAEQARQDEKMDVAGDLETLARLLYDTAAVAGQNRVLAAEAERLEGRLNAEMLEFSAADAEREEVVALAIAEQTREFSMNEARRAYVLASIDEPQRFRRRSQEVQRARVIATAALANRVVLISAAAQSLGGVMPDDMEQQFAGLRDTADTALAMRRVREMHEAAMARLGAARRDQGATPAQCRSFVEMALERGLAADLGPEGVSIREVSINQARVLAELLSSFLTGPVILQSENARSVQQALVQLQVPETRITIAPGFGDVILLPACAN